MDRSRLVARAAAPLLLAGAWLGVAGGSANAACNLGNNITHVVHITFDNVHLRRDNPNVPSDLEQMPNLLNFLLANGTVSGNHFTPLISHTANDIITALTGVYPDRHGIPVSNSYRVFDSAGHPTGSHSDFIYWTATDSTDNLPVMVNEKGKTAPAPWVSYTRAGCDFGGYSTANIEFESVPGDLGTVYGTGSPEFLQAKADLASPDPATRQKPQTDWLGIAIHCAQASPICAGGKPDLLPDEPGPQGQPGPNQYVGFNALYGSVNVQPAISSGPVKDLDGNPITDSFGRPGFVNGFSPTATQTLGYLATMLEKGIPVVYGYISDAHDNRTGAGTFGPGEVGYVAQLQSYNKAFGQFFSRLAAKGINKTNTLFIITADENDHFVGGSPTPANCDGVSVPCSYLYPGTTTRSVGELTATLDSLLLTQRGSKTQFLVHADDAPVIYIDTNPAPTDVLMRNLEHDAAALTFVNPLPGKNGRSDTLGQFFADRAEMKLLHMVNFSQARTPSFTMFGNPDYFFVTSKGTLPLALQTCTTPVIPPTDPTGCVFQNSGFAWNHGDIQQQIVRAWFGMVGPGVRTTGRDDSVFSDHTDLRPTALALLKLTDDYVHDGRVLVEKLDRRALAASLAAPKSEDENVFVELAQIYKQLNAPLGSVGRNSAALATRSIKSTDTTYNWFLSVIAPITEQRDALASEIKIALDAAEFGGQPLNESQAGVQIGRARRLIEQVKDLAKREGEWHVD